MIQIPTIFRTNYKRKFILDVYPAKFAISTRVLSKKFLRDWIIQIRRSSDNQEVQVLPDLSLPFAQVSINSPLIGSSSNLGNFVGSGNAFVTSCRNQAMNSSGDAVQPTIANQPRLINTGTIETVVGSNFPGIRFIQASSTYLSLPTSIFTGVVSGEIFWVVNSLNDPAVGTPAFHSMGVDGQNCHYPWTDGVVYEGWGTGSRKSTGDPIPSLASKRVYNIASISGEWTSRIDGSVLFTTSSNTPAFPTSGTPAFFNLGRNIGNSFFFDGTVGEMIIFDGYLNTTARSLITRELLTL